MTVPYLLRWLVPTDLPAVRGVEEASYPSAWSGPVWLAWLRHPESVTRVAEHRESGEILAYACYRLERETGLIVLERLAVKESWRRKGVGRAFVEKLKEKFYLRFPVYDSILAGPPPVATKAAFFLWTCGFRALPAGGAYLFEYRVSPKLRPVVRIAE